MLCVKGKIKCENCSNKADGETCGLPEVEKTKIKAKFDKENKRIKKKKYTLKG